MYGEHQLFLNCDYFFDFCFIRIFKHELSSESFITRSTFLHAYFFRKNSSRSPFGQYSHMSKIGLLMVTHANMFTVKRTLNHVRLIKTIKSHYQIACETLSFASNWFPLEIPVLFARRHFMKCLELNNFILWFTVKHLYCNRIMLIDQRRELNNGSSHNRRYIFGKNSA